MADDRLTNPAYVWNRLDYERDALIEASAGTGKTYALESIVLKLICDKGYEAKSLLLVTFTEKAAGELKDRVRKALVRAGRLPTDFDEMTICTIHAFCQRLLSDYAFENGVPMQCEIGGDSRSLARRAVLEAVRGEAFFERYGATFGEVMANAPWKSVAELVAEAQKRVPREDGAELRAALQQGVERAAAAAAAALDAAGWQIGGEIVRRARFWLSSPPRPYEWLANAFSDLSAPDQAALAGVMDTYPAPRKSDEINPTIRSWDGVSVMTGRRGGKLFDSVPERRDALENVFAALTALQAALDRRRRLHLMADVLQLARPLFENLKNQAALLTFDDLVARAADVVTRAPQTAGETASKAAFLAAVRARYRVALVDEFQDTDQKQWDIFRTLFSSSENAAGADGKPGFLLVVGDPKQAIYSFRGADVDVYRAARRTIAQQETLDEMYRSKRALVDAFNLFFRDAGAGAEAPGSDWFKAGAGGDGIAYRDVCYPRAGNAAFDGMLREREPSPVVLLESLPERIVPTASAGGVRFGNNAACLPVFMENAAKEMIYLNSLVPAYERKTAASGDPPPRFRYGDMCVLVEGKTDAAVVRRVLAQQGIPYGQYKQQGLYDSAEAEGVLALLDYLANPAGRGNRQALLLSPLFGVHPSRLARRTAEQERAFDAFAERLQDCARRREWSRLFESVLTDACTALTSPGKDLCAFNRTRAATRQIVDALLADAGARASTVADFAARLRAWRRNDRAAGEEGSGYQKESAADRVQIMTMHASKGLQFPIVFLAYGFSNQVKKDTPEEERPAARKERRRLLYVALTRAAHRLYLPWSERAWAWTAEKSGQPGEAVAGSGIGSAGSVLLACSEDGFLGRAIQVYFNGRRDEAFAPRRTEAGAGSTPAEAAAVPAAVSVTVPFVKNRRVRWDSFSSLQKHGGGAAPEIAGDGGAAREREPQDRSAPTETLLPRTAVSGVVFHEIMEVLCKNDAAAGEVDFTTACAAGMEREDSVLMDVIRRTMRKNLLAGRVNGGDSTEKTLLRMVQSALRTKIVIGSAAFTLADVPREDRLAEVEFVASETGLLKLPAGREGALNGKIDLLVRRGGKVFILDWKTNSLTDYRSADVLTAAMDDAGYHLQYQLYSLAAAAWLGDTGLTLAGAAYLFVRGGETGAASGVFARAYDAADVEAFRRAIAARSDFAAGKEEA